MEALSKLKSNNAKKEYYITDTIVILRQLGKKVSSIIVEDSCEVSGINTRMELSKVKVCWERKK